MFSNETQGSNKSFYAMTLMYIRLIHPASSWNAFSAKLAVWLVFELALINNFSRPVIKSIGANIKFVMRQFEVVDNIKRHVTP